MLFRFSSLTLSYLLMFFSINSWSAQGLNKRYNTEVFDQFVVEEDVAYGSAKTQSGIRQELIMDVYYPKDDSAETRPLLIFAHGGFFIFGDKIGFEEEGEFFSKSGYVVASINYRLIDVEETDMASKKAVIDAVNDMKAAVRFFTKDAATTNKYRINPDQIFIGGYSAGAVTSLHYAYANTPADVLKMGGKELLKYVDENRGIKGQSGNPGYPANVRGVINLAGSLHSADLIDKDEPILFSVHGTDDQIVPFNSGTTGDTQVVTEGSGLIHARANQIGLVNYLIKIENDGHLARYSCADCLIQMRSFIYENL